MIMLAALLPLLFPFALLATGVLKMPKSIFDTPAPTQPTSSSPSVEASVFSVRNEVLRLGGRMSGSLAGTPGSLQQNLFSEERSQIIQTEKSLTPKPTLFTGELAQAWPQTSRKVTSL